MLPTSSIRPNKDGHNHDYLSSREVSSTKFLASSFLGQARICSSHPGGDTAKPLELCQRCFVIVLKSTSVISVILPDTMIVYEVSIKGLTSGFCNTHFAVSRSCYISFSTSIRVLHNIPAVYTPTALSESHQIFPSVGVKVDFILE
jgi:hypothetical protein